MNILKKLSIFPLIAVLSGCGQVSENIQKEFNGKNYSLKIASKYEKYDVPNSGYDKNEKQRIKMIKRANENGDEEVISYNTDKALVLEYNSQVLTEMHEIDPEIEVDAYSSTINGRLLTAPYEASLVKVQGVALANEEETVDAPVGFQEIEFDPLGTYGNGQNSDFRNDVRLQPKSIKTKTFDASTGFSVARTNVYLYNEEAALSGSSVEDPEIINMRNSSGMDIMDNNGVADYEMTKYAAIARAVNRCFGPDFYEKSDSSCEDFELLPYNEVKHTKVSVASKIKDFSITFDFYFKFNEITIPKE